MAGWARNAQCLDGLLELVQRHHHPPRACVAREHTPVAAGFVDCLAGRAQVEGLHHDGTMITGDLQRHATIEVATTAARATSQQHRGLPAHAILANPGVQPVPPQSDPCQRFVESVDAASRNMVARKRRDGGQFS